MFFPLSLIFSVALADEDLIKKMKSMCYENGSGMSGASSNDERDK